ncbi:hypothetical protein BBO99_00004961 [Phytophthora kernoviae]|uniref:Uncharacterized protein n=2 Tax=Phytophthora kernoviae TaxID=325452 RepID=A0A3R7J7A4_9STRA|nr:hypothetical protein G195_006948 [Phytophthora kernoviae 00238/432]KAG2522146.1 hypothetical protein JM16_005967 [Phytophthora kernoviae]KAG2523780.1 hypothetical protein JM18_005651 [Phytophthora kernoviae]RLN37463.1 hypothetical protein BBI17_006206 [Phytophthora kernoviae]RLN79849.1 hypothetical protein BBO99_00004961 [Phytophthora kernoviae]
MAHWWRRDELLALLQAWEQTLPAPRDRDDLTPEELSKLYDRFVALRPRDGAVVAPLEVEAQRQRLVRTFLFLRAFNAESDRAGRPTWFQLPQHQQEDLRRINGRLGDLAAVAQDEFKELERICDQQVTEEEPTPQEDAPQEDTHHEVRPPVAVDEMKAAAEALAGLPMFRPNNISRPTLSPSLSPPSSPIRTTKKTVAPMGLEVKNDNSDAESLSGNGFASPSEGESEIDESKRRKNSDVDYVPLKGKGKGKNASKWPKRDEKCLVDAWHEVVMRLADTERPGAFASRAEALKLNSLVHDKFAELCKGRAPRTNQSTGAKKHAMITAFRFLRGLLRELASLSDRPNCRDAGYINGGTARSTKRRRTGLSDPVWVTRLLDAQTQRFESLLTEFREERRQERQHNVEIIVEALKLRSATAQKSDQTSPFVEGLVEKQRQHMLDLFNQLQEERSQEREQARMLLRELSNSGLVSSQDSEEKE